MLSRTRMPATDDGGSAMKILFVVLIAVGMSIVGNLLVEAAGCPKLQSAGAWGREWHYAYIAVVSCVVWLGAYHLWIRRGTRMHDLVMLAIGMPFVGTFIAIPFYGLFAYFWFWWVFIPVSLVTACLLALVARQPE